MTLNEVAHIVGKETVDSWILKTLVNSNYSYDVIIGFCKENNLDRRKDFPEEEFEEVLEAHRFAIEACPDETDCEFIYEDGTYDKDQLSYYPAELQKNWKIIESWYKP